MNGRFCDFHLHSNCSDGRLPPADLVDVVADAGVQIMALTDHDTLSGVEDAEKRARARGITFVPGIEMTTYAAPDVVHVLGLGITAGARLDEINRSTQRVWAENQFRWIAALEAEGHDVSANRDFPDLPIRLPVLIERLCGRGLEAGHPRAVHARFNEFFHSLPPQAYAGLLSPAQAAAAIRSCGGVAVLAHPDRMKHEAAAALARDFDAIEADYAAYSADRRAQLRSLARSLGKTYTCGSDFHGYFTADYDNLRFTAPPELLALLHF